MYSDLLNMFFNTQIGFEYLTFVFEQRKSVQIEFLALNVLIYVLLTVDSSHFYPTNCFRYNFYKKLV